MVRLDLLLLTRYFITMLCHQCYKDKPDHLIGKKTGICRTCLYGERVRKYRQKNKAKISAYFKKWYAAKGRQKRKGNSYPKRNRRIYEMYMDTNKRYSMGAIAKMFQISPPRVFKIIKQEEKKI